ncbi:H/ACA ribonucleoprotein complex subunit GAR1 [Candidatus Halobonum tyrrellensis]|uniref:H/ACA RNA-protein complex component Gar1 n=1 Tax=Candidatus Halobonum tyrrellensis G22 TaxID=1324957 RepID=V4GSF4_9EURY|nr:Gar1/Naf1 family protein [Candidatus Halobonum tyrrellensis]ESP88026.1 H/ACA RNA-protein complex component Gar1 [Candidatus Halobonum tyrrellensis G22]
MRRVGEVVRTAGGVAVVRVPEGDDPADVGTETLDDSLTTVGRVVDVFGPVDRPYVAVSPVDRDALPSLLGATLYAR